MPGAARSVSISGWPTSVDVAMSISAEPASATADVHVGDVDAGVAEQRPDRADHAGPVVVGDHQHVIRRRHVDAVAVDPHDPLLATPSSSTCR